VKRGGVIVIPAFAVDRTQMLMYYLRELVDQKQIPVLPVYVDSPMAINVTDIYTRHPEDHDSDYTNEEQHGLGDPLNMKLVHLTRTVDDSKRINNVTTSCIIVSASGMATGGRVLHHLATRLPDPRNTVLLVGYQADGTKGRALQDGAKSITLFGQQVPVRAQVVSMGQLSAHAGKSELLRWLSGFTAPPRQTFLVHGEPVALNALRDAVTAQFKWPVTIPAYLQTFDLSPM
jgi:metallo-beta-lactamase family protein